MQCIDNCANDNYYKYDYNSKCYHSCPNGTHISKYNNYICEKDLICDNYIDLDLTQCFDYIPLGYYLYDPNEKIIDKCNITCLNCTSESNELNSCVSCNITGGYYPKYNDSSSNEPFVKCYNEDIEKYFLDINNNIYMPCYSICKACNWYGDESENNCTECYENYTFKNGNCNQENQNNNEIFSSIPSEVINNQSSDFFYQIVFIIQWNIIIQIIQIVILLLRI